VFYEILGGYLIISKKNFLKLKKILAKPLWKPKQWMGLEFWAYMCGRKGSSIFVVFFYPKDQKTSLIYLSSRFVRLG
jgi:hypothetical protein